MGMGERLVELRERHLNMSQREFCAGLSLTQSTYAPLERQKREIRDVYVKMVCSVYDVNEAWLRYGTPPIFNSEEPDYDLQELLRVYENLTPQLRKLLIKHARDFKNLQDEQDI